MYKDALGENGMRSAFCLFYVDQSHYDQLKTFDFNYEVPQDPDDEPNHYSKIVPKPL